MIMENMAFNKFYFFMQISKRGMY